MTFYNIIFGILFLGAFRVVIRSLASGPPDWKLFPLAAILSILIFSDTIYTSLVIEGHRTRYSIWMKLLDLTSFIILSFAIVVLDPTDKNIVSVDVQILLANVTGWMRCSREALFWLLLAAYTVSMITWHHWAATYAELDRPWGRRLWLAQPFLLILFLLMAVLTWPIPWLPVAPVGPGRWLLFALTLVYLVGYKPLLTWHLERVVAVKPLTATDVQAIRCWPAYTGRFLPLDYALRENGWLDQFPASATNRRWGAWRDGELVGFALLTNIQNEEAEFYLAVHPDRFRQGVGREITRKVLDLGTKQLGLKRIYLRVRDWHTDAIGLYKSVGFKELPGTQVNTVNGAPVTFVTMEYTT
jgi:RimJ/RimL family protein N-acetyltransferase